MNVECFGCSGGMAKGFQLAGLEFDLSFDYDEDACASYEKNIGHKPIRLDVRDLVTLTNHGFVPWPEAVDLFVADPPCTPWSRAGKRKGLDDDRDMLRETVNLIRRLRPKAYLIGNMPGLQDAKSWNVVQDVLKPLHEEGYCIADYAQLDAADYGVPQNRVRPFWFGHLREHLPACITWPSPTHGDFSKQMQLPGISDLKPWVTCRDALAHLTPKDLGRPVRLRWKDGVRGPNHRPSTTDRPAKTITRNTHSDGTLLIHERHPFSELDEPARTITAASGTTGGKVLCQGKRVGTASRPARTVTSTLARVGAGGAVTLEWPWDRPSTTILSDPRLSSPGHHSIHRGRSTVHGPNAIVLSERAAKLLQSFPDEWIFAGETKKKRWAQIGMAMPPLLAYAVAQSVIRAVWPARFAGSPASRSSRDLGALAPRRRRRRADR